MAVLELLFAAASKASTASFNQLELEMALSASVSQLS